MEPRRVGQRVEGMASDPSSGPFWGSSVICHRSRPYSLTMIYITMPTGHNSELAGKSGIDLGLALISPPSMDGGPGVGAGTRVMGEVQGGSSPLPCTCFGTPHGSGAGVSQRLSRLMALSSSGGINGQCLPGSGTGHLRKQKISLPTRRAVKKSYESPFTGHQELLGPQPECPIPQLFPLSSQSRRQSSVTSVENVDCIQNTEASHAATQ